MSQVDYHYFCKAEVAEQADRIRELVASLIASEVDLNKAEAENERLRAEVGRLEIGLAAMYEQEEYRAVVAEICDEVIDPKGALLGRVRILAAPDGGSG